MQLENLNAKYLEKNEIELENLNTKYLGRNEIHYKSIDSTQSEIWRLYENKEIPNGTLVMADFQTNGKGTHGRKWYTDKANNIAFSFFIKMNCNIKKVEGLTTEIAEIIVNILKSYDIIVRIKEPNDIILNDKKLGGILTETKVIEEQVKCLVIGIGLNINQEKFAPEIIDIATSIKKETGKEIEAQEFISRFCNEFERYIIEKLN